VRLALHPEDALLVRDTLIAGDSASNIQIIDDPVQVRGGCRVITDTSQIDASIETRLNAVIAHVLGGQRRGDGEREGSARPGAARCGRSACSPICDAPASSNRWSLQAN